MNKILLQMQKPQSWEDLDDLVKDMDLDEYQKTFLNIAKQNDISLNLWQISNLLKPIRVDRVHNHILDILTRVHLGGVGDSITVKKEEGFFNAVTSYFKELKEVNNLYWLDIKCTESEEP